MTTWNRICCEGAKTHFTPAGLSEGTINDLVARGLPFVSLDAPVSRFFFERRLSIFGDAPHDPFVVDGLVVVIPSADVSCFARKLHESREREYNTPQGRLPFHKLHGATTCLVLTPHNRLDLLQQTEQASKLATEKYDAFLTSRGAPLVHDKLS